MTARRLRFQPLLLADTLAGPRARKSRVVHAQVAAAAAAGRSSPPMHHHSFSLLFGTKRVWCCEGWTDARTRSVARLEWSWSNNLHRTVDVAAAGGWWQRVRARGTRVAAAVRGRRRLGAAAQACVCVCQPAATPHACACMCCSSACGRALTCAGAVTKAEGCSRCRTWGRAACYAGAGCHQLSAGPGRGDRRSAPHHRPCRVRTLC